MHVEECKKCERERTRARARVCVCVYVRERERDIEGGREGERERGGGRESASERQQQFFSPVAATCYEFFISYAGCLQEHPRPSVQHVNA